MLAFWDGSSRGTKFVIDKCGEMEVKVYYVKVQLVVIFNKILPISEKLMEKTANFKKRLKKGSFCGILYYSGTIS